jgi:serine/threonine protein kinase
MSSPESPWPPQPGQRLPEPYGHLELSRCLGAGAFGVVWAAVDHSLNLSLALKFFTAQLELATLREAARYRQVRHQFLVQILELIDLRRQQGWPAYAVSMNRYAASLDRVLALVSPARPLDVEAALRYAGNLAMVLCALHETHRLVHRDLKPANLLLDLRGGSPLAGLPAFEGAELLLGDLGVAEQVGRPALFPLGQDGWKPPELRDGPQTARPAEDVYAFGRVLRSLADALDPQETARARFRALAVICHAAAPEERPSAGDLLGELLSLARQPSVRRSQLVELLRGSYPHCCPVPDDCRELALREELVNALCSASTNEYGPIRALVEEANAVWQLANPLQHREVLPVDVLSRATSARVNWQNVLLDACIMRSTQYLAALLLLQRESDFSDAARGVRQELLARLRQAAPSSGGSAVV